MILAKVGRYKKSRRFGARNTDERERRKRLERRIAVREVASPPAHFHPSFKTERFFVYPRVTFERDVTGVRSSFLKKKKKKKKRKKMKNEKRRNAYFWNVHTWGMFARANERLDDRTMNLYIYQIPLGYVFRRESLTLPGVEGRKLCNRQSFSFAKRAWDFLEGDMCRESLAENKTPERALPWRGERRGRGEE